MSSFRYRTGLRPSLCLILALMLHGAVVTAYSQQWKVVRDRISATVYSAIAARDEMSCLVAGSTSNGVTSIYGTGDGGSTWSPLFDTTAGLTIRSIAWPTPGTIVFAATDVKGNGRLLGSTNGGGSWRYLGVDSCTGAQVSMCDALNAVTIRTSRSVAYTSDGGVTWRTIPVPKYTQDGGRPLTVSDARCLAPGTLVLLTYNPSGSPEEDYGPHVVFRTEDGGLTWSEWNVWRGRRLDFGDARHGVTSFAGQIPVSATQYEAATVLHTTTDGGRTWKELPTRYQDDSLGMGRVRVAPGGRHMIGLRGGTWDASGAFATLMSADSARSWQPILPAGFGVSPLWIGDVVYPTAKTAWGFTTNGLVVRLRVPVAAAPNGSDVPERMDLTRR